MYSFLGTLKKSDAAVANVIERELTRQKNNIELIASENFVSNAVLEAQGSVLTNKYAEGYPGKRYYSGCEVIDVVEELAKERVKKLFKCSYANVQPHSGSQANQTVYFALLKPGDTTLAMSLDSGGHLTHGAAPNMSGKWFDAKYYNVDPNTYLIDYEEIEKLALLHKPKLIIAGYSCYSRCIDFKKFREIADKVGAYLMADIAHIAGLVATGMHDSPIGHAHVVTSTTHKTLRGPRGGVILADDEEIGQKIDKALFPGLQGGPMMHIIAAKAVAFGEALSAEFTTYIKQVINNARALADVLQKRGYQVLTGGTDNHMVILDLRKYNVTGKLVSDSLDRAGITVNKNSVPFDTISPFIASGIRLGTPACTTRGFSETEFTIVGNMIADLIDQVRITPDHMQDIEQKIREQALTLNKNFPIY